MYIYMYYLSKHHIYIYIYNIIYIKRHRSRSPFTDGAALRNHGHFHRLRSLSCLASHGHRLFQGGRQDALLQELTRDHELPDKQKKNMVNTGKHTTLLSFMCFTYVIIFDYITGCICEHIIVNNWRMTWDGACMIHFYPCMPWMMTISTSGKWLVTVLFFLWFSVVCSCFFSI